ncbi:MAG: AAA family ATPase, partial [Gammaproteobacteria bacterium]|nr:AAA family ATPase [Gammaproteobacteria bacterium]
MKLQSARVRNFKLLRNIDLSFSTRQDVPLTVIRAENGSGKTSVLQALRWALYGTKGLDDPLVRLSPADWLDGEPCKISVEIDFSHTLVSTVGDHDLTKETRFILKREVIERPAGDLPNREPERISLYEKKETGSDPINAPEARLDQMLPSEMLDIFFTDGDAAMTFISPQLAETTKRDQVKEAIRSLLGLGLLEGVNKRIQAEQSSVNRKISKQAGSDELAVVSKSLQDAMDERTKLANDIESFNHQIENLDRKLSIVQRDLQRLLDAGNYEHLAHQQKTFQKQLEAAKEDDKQFKKRHQQLFENELVTTRPPDPGSDCPVYSGV